MVGSYRPEADDDDSVTISKWWNVLLKINISLLVMKTQKHLRYLGIAPISEMLHEFPFTPLRFF
jgi:hypothetical protein